MDRSCRRVAEHAVTCNEFVSRGFDPMAPLDDRRRTVETEYRRYRNEGKADGVH